MKFTLILLLFIASGFSSLIYQVVWTRMLVFVFGSTTFATATVLAVFMGGLALGSYWAGRKADNIKLPFIWYGLLEGIIGLWALFAPGMFDAVTPLYKMLWQQLHLAPLPFGMLRFFAAMAILIVPTTCMGATLPLLSKYVADRLEYIGDRIGTLYAANTLGAVGGAAVAGLYLLPSFGLNRTITIAAMINFVLVGVVFVMASALEGKGSRRRKKHSAGSQTPEFSKESDTQAPGFMQAGSQPDAEQAELSEPNLEDNAGQAEPTQSESSEEDSVDETVAEADAEAAATEAVFVFAASAGASAASALARAEHTAACGITGSDTSEALTQLEPELVPLFTSLTPPKECASEQCEGLLSEDDRSPATHPAASDGASLPVTPPDGTEVVPPSSSAETGEPLASAPERAHDTTGIAARQYTETTPPAADTAPSTAASTAPTHDAAPSTSATSSTPPTHNAAGGGTEKEEKARKERKPQQLDLSTQTVFVMGAFAVSGAVAMIYEVGWTRTLLMVIGSSTYAFTLMLTSFLSGIFLGSLVCAKLIDKAKSPLVWLAVIQLLVAAASIFSMDRFNYIPFWNLQLNAQFPSDPDRSLVARFIIAASIMMPLTFFLGAVFPAAVKACVNDLSKVGKSIGSLYSANTVGAIAGAFLAGFILIPFMGVERSLIAGTVVNLLTGVALLCVSPSLHRPLKAVVLVAGCLTSYFLCTRTGIWDKDLLVYAQSARRRIARLPNFNSPSDFRKWLSEHSEMQYYEDGASSTVAILQWVSKDLKRLHHSLITNGHVDASDEDDMGTQLLLACTPVAAHPDPKEVAIIGWGSGVTVGTAARLSGGNTTAIELEPAVINTSRFFHNVNHAPEKDPRVHIEINDGRNFLLATDQKFDVIISEPSNPWQAGVCNLFTKEYFKLAKDRLRPHGIFALWCQIVEVPGVNLKGILAAVHAVFPYCAVQLVDDCDIVVLASLEPIAIDIERVRQLMKNKDVAEDFRQAGVNSPEAFMARFAIPPEGVSRFIGTVAPNDDDSNHLEYQVGRTYENPATHSMDKNLSLFNGKSQDLAPLLKWRNDSDQTKAKVMCDIGKEARLLDAKIRSNDWLRASLSLNPSAEGYLQLGILQYQSGFYPQALECWSNALKLEPENAEVMLTRGAAYLDLGGRSKARADFEKVLSLDPRNQTAQLRIAQSYAPQMVLDILVLSPSAEENPQLVLQKITPLLNDKKFAESNPSAYWLAAWAQYKMGKFGEAEQLAKKVIALDREFPAAVQLLAEVLCAEGKYPEASVCWRGIFQGSDNSARVLLTRAKEQMERGQYHEALTSVQVLLCVNPYDKDGMAALKTLAEYEPKAGVLLQRLTSLKQKLL